MDICERIFKSSIFNNQCRHSTSHLFGGTFYFMQTLEITFQKNYHTSIDDRYLMETLIIKVQADTAGEDAQILWDKARQEAELNHRRNNPHLFPPDIPKKQAPKVNEYFSVLPVPDGIYGKTLEEEIQSCKSIGVLKIYEKRVKGKPDLEKIYSEKLKELSP